MKSDSFTASPWPLKSIGEICHPKETTNPHKKPKEEFDYVDISSVDSNTRSITNPKHLIGENAPSRARKRIRRNDVILATTRPYLKSIAMVNERFDGQICSTGFAVLRAMKSVDPEWLFHAVTSDEFISQLTAVMRGANYPAVRDSDVNEAKVPVPPLEEQCRIVARIQECLSRVEEMERLQAEVAEDAGKLANAFRTDLWNKLKESSDEVSLGELVSSAKNGLYKPSKFHGSGTVLLRMFNIRDGMMDLSRLERVQTTNQEAEKFLVRNGYIIVSRVNSRELVGKSALVEGLGEAAVNEAMVIRLTLNPAVANPRFVSWMMNSGPFLCELRKRAKHAIGQSSINQKDLLTMVLPLPTLDNQSAIVDRYEQVVPGTTEMCTSTGEQTPHFSALRNAILRQAFAGEL